MKEKFEKLEKHWFWIWIKNNIVVLGFIGAVLVFLLNSLLFPLISKHSQEMLANKKPNVKITSISYKGQIYQEFNGPMSEAVNFLIMIRNEGDANAYDVQIKEKVLGLPRGKYGLETASLQTLLTGTRFDLPERKIAADSIFIDDTPANMQKVRNGEIPITIEYEIIYYGDQNKRNGQYIYTYKNFTTNGIFKEDTAEESLVLKP